MHHQQERIQPRRPRPRQRSEVLTGAPGMRHGPGEGARRPRPNVVIAAETGRCRTAPRHRRDTRSARGRDTRHWLGQGGVHDEVAHLHGDQTDIPAIEGCQSRRICQKHRRPALTPWRLWPLRGYRLFRGHAVRVGTRPRVATTSLASPRLRRWSAPIFLIICWSVSNPDQRDRIPHFAPEMSERKPVACTHFHTGYAVGHITRPKVAATPPVSNSPGGCVR